MFTHYIKKDVGIHRLKMGQGLKVLVENGQNMFFNPSPIMFSGRFLFVLITNILYFKTLAFDYLLFTFDNQS